MNGFLKKLFFRIKVLFYRFKTSVSLMTLLEKRLVIVFLIIFLFLVGVKINRIYMSDTLPIPGVGGDYSEAVVGELKYLNPILVSSDTDKSTSRLIFSSLIWADKDNKLIMDVASKYEVSPDNLKYSFTLRDDVYFHDGGKLAASDVEYTVSQMKDSGMKTPFYDKWKDVNVETVGENVVVFSLPKAYGAFIYNCDFGILPSYLSMDAVSKGFVGSGPYKFVSTEKTNDVVGSHISKLTLLSNDNYFAGAPFITNFELSFFDDKAKAQKAFKSKDYNALSGTYFADVDDVNNLSFPTSKRLSLIFNLRNEKLKNKETRDKIIKSTKFDASLALTLTTLDNELQRQKAEEIKNQFSQINVSINIKYLSVIDLGDVIDKKDYELLLYGFDFGHDRDFYAFWHTSQMNKNNFAGFSDKNSDILLEDARMTADPVIRAQKYDQFAQTIQSESLAIFYDPITYNFYQKKEIKGADSDWHHDVSAKYFNAERWYIKESRIKK